MDYRRSASCTTFGAPRGNRSGRWRWRLATGLGSRPDAGSACWNRRTERGRRLMDAWADYVTAG